MCLREGWLPSWSLATTCGSTWCRRCPLLTQPFLNEWFLPRTGMSLMKWSIRIFWKRRVMLMPIFELTHISREATPCCWARCRSRISRLRRRWAQLGTVPGRCSPRTCPTLATSPTRSGHLQRNAANPTQQLYPWPLTSESQNCWPFIQLSFHWCYFSLVSSTAVLLLLLNWIMCISKISDNVTPFTEIAAGYRQTFYFKSIIFPYKPVTIVYFILYDLLPIWSKLLFS